MQGETHHARMFVYITKSIVPGQAAVRSVIDPRMTLEWGGGKTNTASECQAAKRDKGR